MDSENDMKISVEEKQEQVFNALVQEEVQDMEAYRRQLRTFRNIWIVINMILFIGLVGMFFPELWR